MLGALKCCRCWEDWISDFADDKKCENNNEIQILFKSHFKKKDSELECGGGMDGAVGFEIIKNVERKKEETLLRKHHLFEHGI